MTISKKHKYSIKAVLFFIPFLLGMGVDLYVPSLPAITSYFHTQAHWVQLTVGIYMLGYGVGQFVLGIISDATGRRPILLASGFVFVIVSVLAALSPSILLLNVYRLLQGLAMAGLSVVGRAVMVDCFSGVELAKATAFLSFSWGIGPILGPFIGGYLQYFIGWQANFYFFAIYGLALFVFIYAMLPETIAHKQSLQPKALLFNFKQVSANVRFLLSALSIAFAYSILVIFNVQGPYLVQNVMGYSAVAYGYVGLLLGLAYLLGNLSNRLLINKFCVKNIILTGILVAFVFSVVLWGLSLQAQVLSLLALLLPCFIIFMMISWIIPNSFSRAISLFPNMAGMANALCGAIISFGVFFFSLFASHEKIHSAEPLALLYMLILIFVMLFFVVVHVKEKRRYGDG